MGHPSYSPERHGTGLVSAYIKRIGYSERPNRSVAALRSRCSLHASHLIAQGCVAIVDGSDRRATRLLTQARDNMRPHAAKRRHAGNFSRNRSHGAHLFHLTEMLLERDEKTAAESFQVATHRQAVQDLVDINRHLGASEGEEKELLTGHRTEQVAIALLTRYQDIGNLSVRALVHHDTGHQPKGNYDLLVVDSSVGSGDYITAHEGQVKTGCQNFCRGNEGKPTGLETRAKYLQHITIISGHCDIFDGLEPEQLSQWLVDEVETSASPEVVDTLNNRTLNLMDILVEPQPWRMGTLQA